MSAGRRLEPSRFFRSMLSATVAMFLIACTSCRMAERREAARQRGALVAAASKEGWNYLLQPGDKVNLSFFYNPDLDRELIIRPDGRFSLPLIGDVHAAGRSLSDLAGSLRRQYGTYLKHPEVTANVTSFSSQIAYIGGEVRKPGVVAVGSNMTVLQSIIMAGGSLDTGDLKNVVIVRNQGTTEPLIMMMNLTQGIERLAVHNDLRLRPSDIVFVPKTAIAKAGQFVREFIKGLLPMQLSLNYHYQLNELTEFGTSVR